MKRIEFIAPVEAMRGNLSGKQKLEYPTDNQGAYEGPVGSVNYARNYGARFIGAKIAKSGKKYFAVRTKTANHLTAKAKKAMALLGGTGAIVGAILANKSSQIYAECYAQWLELQDMGSNKTFRQSLSDAVRAGLIAKSATIPYAGPRGVVNITNPWNYTGETPNVTIAQQVLVKFWTELAANAIEFTIDGLKGVAHSGDDFGSLSERPYNVLSLTREAGQTGNMMFGGRYFYDPSSTNSIGEQDVVGSNVEYTTTQPE